MSLLVIDGIFIHIVDHMFNNEQRCGNVTGHVEITKWNYMRDFYVRTEVIRNKNTRQIREMVILQRWFFAFHTTNLISLANIRRDGFNIIAWSVVMHNPRVVSFFLSQHIFFITFTFARCVFRLWTRTNAPQKRSLVYIYLFLFFLPRTSRLASISTEAKAFVAPLLFTCPISDKI